MSALNYVVETGTGALTVKDSVKLCTATVAQKEYAWLELTMPRSLFDGGDQQVITVLVGATKVGNEWKCMNTRPSLYRAQSLAGEMSSLPAIYAFQKAIVDDWQGFDGANVGQWAKGKTFGKSFTSASFVAKALKTGFEAIGKPQSAYSGAKLSDWSVSDLEKYANARRQTFVWRDHKLGAFADVAAHFLELLPDPKLEKSEEEAIRNPDQNMPAREIGHIRSAKAKSHGGNFAYATELQSVNLERVIGYGFRGDSRDPIKLKELFSGAFTPNYTRTDQNTKVDDALAEWIVTNLSKLQTDRAIDPEVVRKARLLGRGDLSTGFKAYIKQNPGDANKLRAALATSKPAMAGDFVGSTGQVRTFGQLDTGALDLDEYVQNEFMGGFVSVSRSVMVAKSFACGRGGNASGREGWVYVCFVEGAFSMPLKGTHPLAKKQEFELAMPGMLEWEDVAGWRKVAVDGKFTGPVYLRHSLLKSDPTAFEQLYRILSGKSQ